MDFSLPVGLMFSHIFVNWLCYLFGCFAHVAVRVLGISFRNFCDVSSSYSTDVCCSTADFSLLVFEFPLIFVLLLWDTRAVSSVPEDSS